MAVVAEALVGAGYRVATYDAPGHGTADGRLSGLPEMATAIERVRDRIGPLRAVVAHSLGAAAATIAVARGLAVQRLVYVSAPDDPGVYLHRAARHLGFGDTVGRRAQARIERRFDFPFAAARGAALAPAIETPLLAIHDRADPLVPHDAAETLVEAWPGAILKSTSGLGHHRILRDPGVVAAAVAFIAPSNTEAFQDTPRRTAVSAG